MPGQASHPARALECLDPKAVRILFDTYWRPGGWKHRSEQQTPPGDFAYAKRMGVMFDPVRIRHDDLIKKLADRVSRIDQEGVAAAFLVSLGSRRLELRSALGIYAFARHLPGHRFQGVDGRCDICGQHRDRGKEEDLNVLNFERLKWGGVRHTDPLFTWFDLTEFSKLEVPRPTSEDRGILCGILERARSTPSGVTVQELQRSLTGLFKSTKSERDILLDILGLSGILETSAHPGFMTRFTPSSRREEPPWRFVEREYPVCWWRGRDGVNETRVRELFGSL